METYTVKAGDTLASIALQKYGSAKVWRQIADQNGIRNPSALRIGQVLNLPTITAAQADKSILSIQGKYVFYHTPGAPETKKLGKLFRLGLYRVGTNETEDFIDANAALLADLKLSSSEINTLLATSENEGNLDAINTWDNSYLSFGMFQWTAGSGVNKGELPALLKLIKSHHPTEFQTYFGQYGLDVTADTSLTSGMFSLNGNRMDTVAEKSVLRQNIWAYRFAMAGFSPKVCAVEVLHAINRFNRFYFTRSASLGNFTLFQLLSSEYAASLLLDNHVNRPGYVFKCVALAISQLKMTFQQVANGDNSVEQKVITQYLKVRATYGRSPMTDANTRAKVTQQFVAQGKISNQKGSFKSNRSLRA